ncbi:MAG TPA: hypothetical protein VH415_03305 [Nitrososphaeraceae archaeon]
MQNLIITKLVLCVTLITLGITGSLFLSHSQDIYSQSSMNMSNNTAQKHAVHTIDNLVISEHIPLTGRLDVGDYLLLMDFTPFSTSVEGHSHVALKVPCNQDGIPKIAIATGIAPKLNTLDLGNLIINGTLDSKEMNLSSKGQSCLFHSDLPNGITDIVLINTSNETLDFDTGGFSVTVSIHGTAIQHGGVSMP